jgi:hypothetical protein
VQSHAHSAIGGAVTGRKRCAACLADDLDYIGLDGDTVTIGTYQRTYWHDGASVERPVHADAANALLQGIGKAVERLTRAATSGVVKVHGGAPRPAAARPSNTRNFVESSRAVARRF